MDFAEAMSAVREGKAAEEHFAIIEKERNDAHSAAIGHKSKADNYAPIVEKYRGIEMILSENGFDLGADIGEQLKKLRTTSTGDTNEMTRKVSALESQLNEFKKSAEEKDVALRRETATNFFSKTFNDSQFIGGDMFLKGLMLSGEIGVDKENKPFVKIGDDYLPPDTGLAKLIESNPSIKAAKKNTQNAGGGTTGAGGGASKTKSLAEFNSLGAKDKAAFMSGGGKII